MGILALLKRMTSKKDADLWGEWCARTMVRDFERKMKRYRSTKPTGAFIARQAILARRKWEAVGTSAVYFTETSDIIRTSDTFTLRDAIHGVIDIEYPCELRKRPAKEKGEMVQLCHQGAERFLNKMN